MSIGWISFYLMFMGIGFVLLGTILCRQYSRPFCEGLIHVGVWFIVLSITGFGVVILDGLVAWMAG